MSTPEPAHAPAKPITIARADLTSEVSRALIEALNAELTGAYPEPGATHFGLAPEEVAGGRGAFLIIYEEGTPVERSKPRRGPWAFGGWSSKRASGKLPPSRSIGQPALNRFPFTENTASPRKPASVSARCLRTATNFCDGGIS